ncbi:dihydrodipicolinate synthase family protein [Mucilaginibacter boryungensis]|uniref:Dihydrodipicolinate synthase family protein n=1 Tax=Mucilaginibacter boryungensis TaxID=768480 RepID=A0ABR9XJG4_9SPHI|nr:dihydrodipicolinate synthase family protein [Mucilaginibacter boryungensis]MBE9667153.1 dihydrodipicolinate synthase family protein [Mucilaginibacter boryungensis]
MRKIEGLIAAVFTPFNNDGSLNLKMIPLLVEKMISDGLKGIFICGTNGEGLNMTINERMQVAEQFVMSAKGRILVFIHVGHTAVTESKKLAAHAASIGADAISSVPAFYFKPNSLHNLVNCIAEIASAAPSLPYYYYHVPAFTGNVDLIEFLDACKEKVPNLAGIKYTASTLYEYQSCLDYDNGKFDILSGFDEMLLSALAVGARGAIGSTYNFAVPFYHDIINLFRSGDISKARAIQAKMVQMIRILFKFSPIPAQRAIMKMLGYDLGPCRLPLVDLTDPEFKLLKESLEEIDFFNLLKQYDESNSPVVLDK